MDHKGKLKKPAKLKIQLSAGSPKQVKWFRNGKEVDNSDFRLIMQSLLILGGMSKGFSANFFNFEGCMSNFFTDKSPETAVRNS